jgi:hypothetical protein
MSTPRKSPPSQIEDPNLEGFSESAFDEPTDGMLTPEQFAARVAIKREQAAQDAGHTVPPGLGADVEPLPDEGTPDRDTETDDEVETPDAEPEKPDTEEDTEEEAPEEPSAEEEEQEEDEEEFFLVTDSSRYKTPEAAAEAFSEKDRTIERLFKELNERDRQRQAEPQQPQEIDVRAWNEWAAQVVESGAGEHGAMEALRTGGQQGYDIYAAHWIGVDDVEERAKAQAFNNVVQREFAAQSALRAVSPLLAERQKQTEGQEAEAARERVKQQHPDFDDYADEMDKLITEPGLLSENVRQWLFDLSKQGAEGKERAWDYLYMAAAAKAAPSRRKAADAERSRRRASADRAKVAATVSTSEGAATRTPLSEAELTEIRYKNRLRKEWGQPLLPEE